MSPPGTAERRGARLDEAAARVLARCSRPDTSATGYGMDMVSVAVVGLEMIRRLAVAPPRWPDEVALLLEPEPAAAV